MVKATSAAFDTHIAGEATTLATLFRATRRDGKVFTFTDHDRDIVINVDDVTDTDNAKTYDAETGFTRTSIVNTSKLSVDNMDIESILDSAGVLEKEIRAGLWDFAQIEVYMVNWDDVTMGVMQLRRGFLGEVSLRDEIYFAELRGLVQLLQQVDGDVYTPNCRADLGDTECGFALPTITETTEVTAIDSANRIITVPVNFLGRTQFDREADFFFSIGVKIDDTDDPSQGKLTILKRATVEDGTFRNPFIVTTATDVTNIRDDVLAWYALAGDIDMTAFGLFTPIPAFAGGLDGRGYEISNLDLDHNAAPLGTDVGLFRDILGGAIIRRLGLINPDVDAGSSAEFKAALVGSVAGGSVVEDCFVEDTGTGNIETDGNRAGGLIGTTNGSTIRRCWSAISFTGAVGALVGGLIGEDNGGGNTINTNRQDETIGITALGSGISTTEVVSLTTAQMQTRAQWTEPAGATVELKTASLPSRTGLFFDFFTIWFPPVASTSRPSLRQWY